MWTRVGALRDLEELLLGSGPNQDFPVEDAELQIMFPGDLRPLLSALRVLGLKSMNISILASVSASLPVRDQFLHLPLP